ncbi:Vancomycin resistance protein YoaR, contains peptidoglycan-binding and VanW domains [Halobacillus dabanensis]|uniref:Vancomycin resistance protein YoaR, contains peptidoglycan-binding and VanW domains n=1 Tax=Halobacillus dabanensis TaxID=240302 RepID=A0A1I3S8M3_HALDA|nr:VanW family protein [Halobacillus dabanensis]SFJ53901.1 Vancomycin resistance protein YoaR, contains peptidoglycan-binding and VanW domains [Halobacillus dabanensis]
MKFMFLSFLLLFITPQENVPDSFELRHEGQNIERIDKEDFIIPYLDENMVDEQKFEAFLDELDDKVAKEPVNAIIDEGGSIVQGKPGAKVDRTKLKAQFYQYFYTNRVKSSNVPMSPVYPQVDAELLEEIRTQQIGNYLTYYKKSNKGRTTNISLATESINNHVVFPGEVFSFNKVVGKRTKEKGYVRAPVIVRGELEDGIGGGICQVSSTLFNAADNAGLKIVERYSHSRKVPYVPPGRDATVSWYGPDFTFKNEFNTPVLIQAKSVNGMVIVQIYSSDDLVKKAD